MRKSILILLFACVFMTACSDLEPVGLPTAPKVSPTISHSGARSSTTYSPDGTSTTVIDVDPSIINNFQHWWQNDPTSQSLLGRVPASQSYGATSYMMAANCIARYKSLTYGVSASKQKQIFDVVGKNTSIDNLWRYGNNQDVSFIRARLPGATYDRATLKSWIENYLTDNSFVIVGVNACIADGKKLASGLVHTEPYYSTSPSVNPDLDGSVLTQKYITSQAIGSTLGDYKVGGHLIVLVSLTKKNPAGTGFVAYVDPISQGHTPSNRKYISYTTLINSIIANSSAGYRVLAISAR